MNQKQITEKCKYLKITIPKIGSGKYVLYC